MNTKHILTGIACGLLTTTLAYTHERIFTYTYEPNTPPKGELEYEQHVTLGAGRDAAVGQSDYDRMDFREEVEYGVTDNYQISLYFNQRYEHFRDPASDRRTSRLLQTGFSLESLYMVLNPSEHRVGLALYLEPTYDGENFELEEKIILGQRYGNWRWALNLTHATEWADNFRKKEGEFETTFGLTRQLSSHWWLGAEFRNHNEIPEYKEWENTAFYVGPVGCYRRANWFATLTVMPQIYGANFTGNPDKNHHLELEGHERVNARLILGFDF